MIEFDCMGYKGSIDKQGFVRWGGMGSFLEDIIPENILNNPIADALLASNMVDEIILNWFDLAFDHECRD